MEAAAFQAPAIPTIAVHFHITANVSSYIVTIYYLALVVGSPLFGKLADRFGRKLILCIGMLAFSSAEVLAAMAASYPQLLVARVLQGLSVACIMPVILSYVSFLFPAEKRGMALGFFAFSMALGAMTGAVLGGFFVDIFGWRSIYWISALMSFLGFFLIFYKVPETQTTLQSFRFDYIGVLLLSLILISALSAPTFFTMHDELKVYGLLLVLSSMLGMILLFFHQKRSPHSLIDVDILRDRSFALSCSLYMLMVVSNTMILYTMAFFISGRPEGSASQVGIVNMMFFFASMVSSLLGGYSMKYFSELKIILASLTISLLGIIAYSLLTVAQPFHYFLIIGFLIGSSQGLKAAALTGLALRNVPRDRMGAGSGLFSMARDVAPSLGVSVGLALYSYVMTINVDTVVMKNLISYKLDISNIEPLLKKYADSTYELPGSIANLFIASDVDPVEFLNAVKYDSMGYIPASVASVIFGIFACCTLLFFMLTRLPKRSLV